MKISQIKTCFAKGWIAFIIALTLLSGIPAFGEELKPLPAEAALAEIRHMEALLLRSCDRVIAIMDDLSKYGKGCQTIEGERAGLYANWAEAYSKECGAFIFVTDKTGAAVPGRFAQAFNGLEVEADKGGVLASAERPKGVDLLALSRGKDGGKYFYYDKLDSASAKDKMALRRKLEGDYEKLVADWNKARDAFYLLFEGNGAMTVNARNLDDKTKEGKEYTKKYNENRAELTDLADSGDYEHCLGKINPEAYTIRQWDDPSAALYAKGEDGSADSLPGMGYQFVAQKEYKAFTKPEVGNFPRALNLKFSGAEYLKYENDLLEIKIKSQEEETFILSAGMGKMGEFGFKSFYKASQSLAAPVDLFKYIVEHPVTSMDGAAGFVKKVPELVKGFLDTPIDKFKPGDFLWGKTGNLIDLAVENANNLNWTRFDPKPGEADGEKYDRLSEQYKSGEKVKEGIETASTITAIAIDIAVTTGGAEVLSAARNAARNAAKTTVETVELETKAALALKKAETIQNLENAAKKSAVLSKEAQKSAEAAKELAEKELQLTKKADLAKEAADANNAKNCALKEKEILEGSTEKALKKEVEACKVVEGEGKALGKAFEGTRSPVADYKNGKALEKHFNDHGKDFGHATKEDYLDGARKYVMKAPTSTTESFVSKGGTYFRYDTATNEFAIVNQYGGISTYFKPADRLKYWAEQIKLYK